MYHDLLLFFCLLLKFCVLFYSRETLFNKRRRKKNGLFHCCRQFSILLFSFRSLFFIVENIWSNHAIDNSQIVSPPFRFIPMGGSKTHKAKNDLVSQSVLLLDSWQCRARTFTPDGVLKTANMPVPRIESIGTFAFSSTRLMVCRNARSCLEMSTFTKFPSSFAASWIRSSSTKEWLMYAVLDLINLLNIHAELFYCSLPL